MVLVRYRTRDPFSLGCSLPPSLGCILKQSISLDRAPVHRRTGLTPAPESPGREDSDGAVLCRRIMVSFDPLRVSEKWLGAYSTWADMQYTKFTNFWLLSV